MAKGPVDTVTMSTVTGKVTPKINLKFTKPNGHTIEMRTVKDHPPTDDMIEMASQLADYLTTGKKPAGWRP